MSYSKILNITYLKIQFQKNPSARTKEFGKRIEPISPILYVQLVQHIHIINSCIGYLHHF